jgi:hypothetical protein
LKRILDAQAPGWLTLEPSELRARVGSIGPISNENRNKLQAIRTLLRQPDAVQDDWRLFNVCVLALNGLTPDFRVAEAPAYAELIGAGGMAARLWADAGQRLAAYPSPLLRYAAAVAMFRNAPQLIPPFADGDVFMSRRGENTAAVADAVAYVLVLARRLEQQAKEIIP